MIVVGIDPSLTGTGLASIDTDDRLVIDTETLASKASGGAVINRWSRLHHLVNAIDNRTVTQGGRARVDLVVIEQPAFSRTNGHHHDRSGLWWLIVDRLTARGIPVVEVTPTGLKKYATGKGNAPKDSVLLAAARRYPHVDVDDNNQADALILAAMGARHLGHPIEDSLPKAHLEAMDKVDWPSIPAVA